MTLKAFFRQLYKLASKSSSLKEAIVLYFLWCLRKKKYSFTLFVSLLNNFEQFQAVHLYQVQVEFKIHPTVQVQPFI